MQRMVAGATGSCLVHLGNLGPNVIYVATEHANPLNRPAQIFPPSKSQRNATEHAYSIKAKAEAEGDANKRKQDSRRNHNQRHKDSPVFDLHPANAIY